MEDYDQLAGSFHRIYADQIAEDRSTVGCGLYGRPKGPVCRAIG